MDYVSLALPVGILGLWMYDHLLLIRAKHYLSQATYNLMWNSIKLYTHFNNRRSEMVKDGYHIDYVYLVINDVSKIKRYDVTSIFREQILVRAFENDGMPLINFTNLCKEHSSNLNVDEVHTDILLDIRYTFDYKKYKIIYNNENIRFPIYSEGEIRDKGHDKGIISAYLVVNESDEIGEEVTEAIDRIAGPMANFYKDHNVKTKIEWILPERKNRFLKMIDSDINMKTYRPDEILF